MPLYGINEIICIASSRCSKLPPHLFVCGVFGGTMRLCPGSLGRYNEHKKEKPMKRIVIAVLVILLATGGGYYYYTTTPTYSILQIRKSVQTHDVVLFQKHVDTDTLYGRLVDDVVGAQMAKMAADTNESGWGKMGQAIGAGMIQMMKPALLTGLKNSTLKYIETGNVGSNDAAGNGQAVIPTSTSTKQENANLDGMMSNFGINDKTKIDYRIVKQGKVANVYVPFVNEDLNMPLEMQFTLRDQGGYWQLVQFNNAAELMTAIEQEQEKRLAVANAEIQKSMQQNIGLVDAQKANRVDDKWGYDKKVLLQIIFQAGSDVPVAKWSGEIFVVDANQTTIFTMKAHAVFEQPLAKGVQQPMVWEVDINQFMDGHLPLWNLPEGKLGVRVKTNQLTFSDGSIAEEYTSYSDFKKKPK